MLYIFRLHAFSFVKLINHLHLIFKFIDNMHFIIKSDIISIFFIRIFFKHYS